MGGPLAGLRVVELTEGVAGPMTGRMLADAGADVVKVELPGGDRSRGWVPARDGVGVVFAALNRDKTPFALDEGGDTAELADLLGTAEVFVVDQQIVDEIGVDIDALVDAGLVVCVITGWGPEGPWATRPGGELPAQLASEATSSLGRPGEEPVRIGTDHAGVSCALYAVQGVMAALIADEGGQRVDVSLFGSMMHMRTALWVALSNPDEWHGFHLDSYTKPPDHYYTCKDRRIWFSVARVPDMEVLVRELRMEFVLDDPRWPLFKVDGGGGLGQHAHLLKDLWDRGLSQWTAEEAEEILVRHSGWVGPCLTYDDFASDPQALHLGLFVNPDDPGGEPIDVRPPWQFSAD